VLHNHGRIVEENHYYAFGLKIAGISSHKLADANEGNTDNKYLYNDKELDDEGDLNWLDYGFRNYDSQIGRFVQVDPLTDEMPDMSTYHYAYNDPITNVDFMGLFGEPITYATKAAADAALNAHGVLKEVVVTGSKKIVKAVAKTAEKVAVKTTERILVPIILNLMKVGLEVRQAGANVKDNVLINIDILSDRFKNWCTERANIIKANVKSLTFQDVSETINEDIMWSIIPEEGILEEAYAKGVLRSSEKQLAREKLVREAEEYVAKLKEKELLRKEAEKLAEELTKKNKELLKLAKKYGVNLQSENTKTLFENFNMNAQEWFGKYRKGMVTRELGDTRNKTIGQVFENADSKTRKLILNGRDKFKK
jgi:RHS repeat-associated protein